MAIYSNNLSYQRARFGAGFGSFGGLNYFNRPGASIQVQSSLQVHPTASFPAGYRAGTAVLLPLADGGMSGRTKCNVQTNAGLVGTAFIAGTCNITVTASANGNLLANIAGICNITITTSGMLTARGFIAGTCNIGAQPSADDIAQAVAGLPIEGAFTIRDILRVLAAVAAGKTTIDDLGGGAAEVIFRDLNDSRDRVTAQMSGSERTDVDLG